MKNKDLSVYLKSCLGPSRSVSTCIPLHRLNQDVTLHCNARRAYEKSLTYVEYQNFEH